MIGRTISHYRIIEKLGEGGMGVVYKAEDTKLDRFVALKFLPPHLSTDATARKRFVHEAKAASALDHPHINNIHEIDETADGRMFIAMAYYEGESLRARLERRPMEAAQAVEIAAQVASGLEKAHERDIVHRDIKPANILITRDGQAKLVDFGLAKLAGQTRVTKTGTTVGTVSYLSPEQARGEEVGVQSDVFSLGVVFYEMLTGRRPFPGDHEAAVIYSILNEDPAPLADLDPGLTDALQRVVDRALAKDPAERYQSIAHMLRDLRAIQTGVAPEPVRPTPRRRTLRAGALGAAVVVALAIVAYLGSRRGEPLTEPAQLGAVDDTTFVIAVAPFWGSGSRANEEGSVMQALIERELRDIFQGDECIRVVGGEIATVPRTDGEARALGEQVSASIVLWGEALVLHDEVEIEPHIALVKQFGAPGQRDVPLFDHPVDQLARTLQANLSEGNQLALRRTKAKEVGNAALLVAATYYAFTKSFAVTESLLDRVSPVSAEALTLKASVLSEQGRTAEADSLIKLAIEGNAKSPWAYNVLGFVLEAKGEYDEAVNAYEKAIEIDSAFAPSYGNAGLLLARRGRLKEALEWYDRTLEKDPSLAVIYWARGDACRRLGRYDQATTAFQKAIDLDSLYTDPYFGMGMIAYNQGRYEEAIPLFEKTLELDPKRQGARHNIGYCYQLLGRPDKAVVYYEAELARRPNNIVSYMNLGHVQYKLGRFEKAAEVYERAVRVDRGAYGRFADLLPYFEILLMLSRARSGQGDIAREEFTQFMSTYEITGWTDRIAGFFAGEISESQLLAHIGEGNPSPDEEKGRTCEASYFLGVAHLLGIPGKGPALRADSSVAVEYLERCVATGNRDYNEYVYAVEELKRLGRAVFDSTTVEAAR